LERVIGHHRALAREKTSAERARSPENERNKRVGDGLEAPHNGSGKRFDLYRQIGRPSEAEQN
jgi:hypothetical protein